jgi:hypothetical protein
VIEMVIIDFNETKKQAFMHGFSKGMAAPVMLFGGFTAPTLPEVQQIIPPSVNDADALEGDWRNIGMDFNNVIKRHG